MWVPSFHSILKSYSILSFLLPFRPFALLRMMPNFMMWTSGQTCIKSIVGILGQQRNARILVMVSHVLATWNWNLGVGLTNLSWHFSWWDLLVGWWFRCDGGDLWKDESVIDLFLFISTLDHQLHETRRCFLFVFFKAGRVSSSKHGDFCHFEGGCTLW